MSGEEIVFWFVITPIFAAAFVHNEYCLWKHLRDKRRSLKASGDT